jgi:hypothetical protein
VIDGVAPDPGMPFAQRAYLSRNDDTGEHCSDDASRLRFPLFISRGEI